jgi:tetrahydromethanopterin S-methyltransferase subunit A
MSKEDFLNSSEFLDMDKDDMQTIPCVSVGKTETVSFDFDYPLENLADEMYEGWQENVTDALQKELNLNEIESKINEVLAKYPAYYEGESVEIDMNPKEENAE